MTFSLRHHCIPGPPAYTLQNILSMVTKNIQIQPQVFLDSSGSEFSGLVGGTKKKI